MGPRALSLFAIVTVAVSAACGSPSDGILEETQFNPEIASEESAAFQLGLVPPVDVVSYLASMCNCGDFVLIDSAGHDIRVRWGGEMWSGYPTGFTIKGQDVEEEETTRAVQQILGIWFNRHCSLEQEARNYPGKRSQMAIDSTDYLCSLVFAITVSSDHCYLTEEISKQ